MKRSLRWSSVGAVIRARTFLTVLLRTITLKITLRFDNMWVVLLCTHSQATLSQLLKLVKFKLKTFSLLKGEIENVEVLVGPIEPAGFQR